MVAWDGINRRRFVRVKVHFRTDILHTGEDTIVAYAEDISKKGLKISITKEIPLKTVVDLLIYLRQDPIQCQAKVVWAKKIEDAHLQGGVVFDTGLTISQISEEDYKILLNAIIQEKNK